MLNYLKNDRENLIKNFVAKVLKDEVPDNKCFVVCYVLSMYLTLYNIEHILKSGSISTSTKRLGHYIIAIKNDNVDVDPTAQQILRTNPQVLIEEKLYPTSNFTEIEINKIYKVWEYPLFKNGSKKPLPKEVLQDLSPQMLEIEN